MGMVPTVTTATASETDSSHSSSETDSLGQLGNSARLPFKDEEDD